MAGVRVQGVFRLAAIAPPWLQYLILPSCSAPAHMQCSQLAYTMLIVFSLTHPRHTIPCVVCAAQDIFNLLPNMNVEALSKALAGGHCCTVGGCSWRKTASGERGLGYCSGAPGCRTVRACMACSRMHVCVEASAVKWELVAARCLNSTDCQVPCASPDTRRQLQSESCSTWALCIDLLPVPPVDACSQVERHDAGHLRCVHDPLSAGAAQADR